MSRSIREYVEWELGRKVELGRLEHKTLVESLQNGDREFLAALNLPKKPFGKFENFQGKSGGVVSIAS